MMLLPYYSECTSYQDPRKKERERTRNTEWKIVRNDFDEMCIYIDLYSNLILGKIPVAAQKPTAETCFSKRISEICIGEILLKKFRQNPG